MTIPRAIQTLIGRHQPVRAEDLPVLNELRGTILRMLYDRELILDEERRLRLP